MCRSCTRFCSSSLGHFNRNSCIFSHKYSSQCAQFAIPFLRLHLLMEQDMVYFDLQPSALQPSQGRSSGSIVLPKRSPIDLATLSKYALSFCLVASIVGHVEQSRPQQARILGFESICANLLFWKVLAMFGVYVGFDFWRCHLVKLGHRVARIITALRA